MTESEASGTRDANGVRQWSSPPCMEGMRHNAIGERHGRSEKWYVFDVRDPLRPCVAVCPDRASAYDEVVRLDALCRKGA